MSIPGRQTPWPIKNGPKKAYIRAIAHCARVAFAFIAFLIVLTTLLSKTGPPWLFHLADFPFQWVCHRIPWRVISIGGAAMPVCSRCAGVWLGLCAGIVLGRPSFQPKTLQWLCAGGAVFMIAEIITQDIGIHPIWHPTRLLSGLWIALPFGGTVGAVLKLASKEGRFLYPRRP